MERSPVLRVLDIDLEIAQRGIPISAQATYRRALGGSRPSAVKAMCLECQGYEDGARKAIRECPSVGCPLHAVRPYQVKAGSVASDLDLDSDIDSEVDSETEVEEHEPGEDVEEHLQSLKQQLTKRTSDKTATIEDQTAILSILSLSTWKSKSQIIAESGINPAVWTLTINYLLSLSQVERMGERKSAKYRRKGEEQ